MAIKSKARHDLTLRSIKREIAAGRDVAYWLDKAYTHLDSGLLTEDDIAEIEALAQAYYDALDVVALGVPAVYFWTFFHSLSLQIKKMGLPRPFYRLLLDDEGLSVWMAGEQDKPEASRKYAWHDMHLAYRTPNAIYLYVQQNQAYLLNDSLDAAWSLLQASLPAERLHDMR